MTSRLSAGTIDSRDRTDCHSASTFHGSTTQPTLSIQHQQQKLPLPVSVILARRLASPRQPSALPISNHDARIVVFLCCCSIQFFTPFFHTFPSREDVSSTRLAVPAHGARSAAAPLLCRHAALRNAHRKKKTQIEEGRLKSLRSFAVCTSRLIPLVFSSSSLLPLRVFRVFLLSTIRICT